MKAPRTRREPLSARTADKHDLYQRAVQNPEFDVELIERVFRQRFGDPPRTLREDFCGTALLCAEWVRDHPERRAVGVDLDAPVLAWGRKRNIAPLGAAASRIDLRNGNVLDPPTEAADVACALNYSYWIFRERALLRDYFANVRRGLARDGLFLLDAFGGWEAQQVRPERRRLGGFTYVWEQALYNPIDAHFQTHIHFEFPDGSRMRRAFSYDWRLWTIPEIRELLAEAGFAQVDVLWEGTTRDGKGDGRFRSRAQVTNDPAWLAYLVAFTR